MPRRQPLGVIVTWDDAVSEPRACVDWDWTPEAIKKIGEDEDSNLVRDRTTRGLLGYIDEQTVKLFKDFDKDNCLGNSTAIPTGWISKITTMTGRVLYEREPRTPTSRGATARARRSKL